MHTNHDRTGYVLEKSTSYQSSLSKNINRKELEGTEKRASSDNNIPKCGLSNKTSTMNGSSTVEKKNQTNVQMYRKSDRGRPKMIIGSSGDHQVNYHSLQRPKKAERDKDMPPMIDRRKSEPPNLGMFSIEDDEDFLPNTAVLDWDSYQNSENTLGNDTSTVATIEVTHLGYQEPSADSISSPRRPSSLNGSRNAGISLGLGSPSLGQSINITNGASTTPRTPGSEKTTPAGTPLGPLPSFTNVQENTDGSSTSHSSTPRHEGGSSLALHTGGTSSSFASVSSLNTEYSTTDDSLAGEEGGFVEVNLYGGGSSGDKLPANFDGQGAKPKKKGIAGFLARWVLWK